MAELGSTKEKHTVRRNRESHRVAICIPCAYIKYIEEAIHKLRNIHGAPNDANFGIRRGFNTWVEAVWFVDRKENNGCEIDYYRNYPDHSRPQDSVHVV